MSRKAKKQTYKAKREYCPETGRDMIVGTRRGTVRFYGNGPMVLPSTAAWFYAGAEEGGKPIGEFMDDIAAAFPKAGFGNPHVERHDSDDPVPLTP